jgi:hypothetical protein
MGVPKLQWGSKLAENVVKEIERKSKQRRRKCTTTEIELREGFTQAHSSFTHTQAGGEENIT